MDISTAVVLAAGEGRRLRPLTRYRPKPMLPAANRPILEYVLDALVNAGIEDLHVVVGYHRDRVQDHFGSRYRSIPITYHIQKKQLGSGHALLQARDAIDSDFLVVNGDEVVGTEMVEAVMEGHTIEEIASLAVLESEAAPQYGVVELDDGMVVKLEEQPTTGRIDIEILAFEPYRGADADDAARASTRKADEKSPAAWRWRLIEGTETVLAVSSDNYDSREAVEVAIATVRETIQDANNLEIDEVAFEFAQRDEG